MSPSSNHFVKVLYPIYQESTLKSVNSFLSSLTFQPLDQAHSKSNSRSIILVPANYADIIAVVWTVSPSLLTKLQRAGEEVGQALKVAPVMEISKASSSAMELLALTMEGR